MRIPIKFTVKVTGGNAMPYRIEEKEAMRIVGIRIPLTEDMEENKKLVPPFWSKTLRGTNSRKAASCQTGL